MRVLPEKIAIDSTNASDCQICADSNYEGLESLPFLDHLVDLVQVDDALEYPRQLAFRALGFFWSPC